MVIHSIPGLSWIICQNWLYKTASLVQFCRVYLQVSFHSAAIMYLNWDPNVQLTKLTPRGKSKSVFIYLVIEGPTSTLPAAVCDSWCRVQMVFLILGFRLQAVPLLTPFLLLNVPHTICFNVRAEKKKAQTLARLLAGW